MPFQIVRNEPGYGAGIDSAVYEVAGKDKLLAKRLGTGCQVQIDFSFTGT